MYGGQHKSGWTKIRLPHCFYCGEAPDAQDHFPPRAYRRTSGAILPACRECNNLASYDEPRDIRARKKLVSERLAKKYKTLLKMPEWNEHELDAASPELRASVAHALASKALVQKRIAWDAEEDIRLVEYQLNGNVAAKEELEERRARRLLER